MRLLYAALPNDGIPTGVKDRKHDDSCGFDTKEYRVGEATRPNATDVAVHNWELRHRRTRAALHAEGRPHESSLKTFSDRCLHFLPRNNVVRIRLVICDSSIELSALGFG